VALLNIDGYYDPLIAMLAHTVEEGFMRQTYFDILQVDADPAGLIARLQAYQPPPKDKWADNREAV